MSRFVASALWFALAAIPPGPDRIAEIQNRAAEAGRSPVAHWGSDPDNYAQWSMHTNRLVPIYTFGGKSAYDLESYMGTASVYRRPDDLRALYGRLPDETVNPQADYCDQTDIFRLQRAALAAGVRYIILVVFDGMDWDATRAAAIARSGTVHQAGRGKGLFFLDYRPEGVATRFGFMATAPYAKSARADVDTQSVAAVEPDGGYDPGSGGPFPWSVPADPEYQKGTGRVRHPYTDSAASATAMTAGIKTYNGAVNIDPQGRQVETIAHRAQQAGYAIGVVTSVPFCHATPGTAYAHNVYRYDYQDIGRDLLGLASISHPQTPLAGVDVLLGAGAGVAKERDPGQGENYVPGNMYLADADRARIDHRAGGRYVVSTARDGMTGREALRADAASAKNGGHRLFGLFGTRFGHLPYQSADGDYRPARDAIGAGEAYTTADLKANPTLADLTEVALEVLAARAENFWLMVEAGDVDFAMHKNNLDAMIGAIHSGDDAVRTIADWLQRRAAWPEALVIVTADHGHYLVLDDPDQLAPERANRVKGP